MSTTIRHIVTAYRFLVAILLCSNIPLQAVTNGDEQSPQTSISFQTGFIQNTGQFEPVQHGGGDHVLYAAH